MIAFDFWVHTGKLRLLYHGNCRSEALLLSQKWHCNFDGENISLDVGKDDD